MTRLDHVGVTRPDLGLGPVLVCDVEPAGLRDAHMPNLTAVRAHNRLHALRAVSSYRHDVDALAAAPTRVVIAVGEESLSTFTGRTAVATAELLGQHATVFPGHHGGFLGGEFGYAGQPEPFARKLRDILDNDN